MLLSSWPFPSIANSHRTQESTDIILQVLLSCCWARSHFPALPTAIEHRSAPTSYFQYYCHAAGLVAISQHCRQQPWDTGVHRHHTSSITVMLLSSEQFPSIANSHGTQESTDIILPVLHWCRWARCHFPALPTAMEHRIAPTSYFQYNCHAVELVAISQLCQQPWNIRVHRHHTSSITVILLSSYPFPSIANSHGTQECTDIILPVSLSCCWARSHFPALPTAIEHRSAPTSYFQYYYHAGGLVAISQHCQQP